LGKVTGFLEYARESPSKRPVTERVNDWLEVVDAFPAARVSTQGARCMACGVPFCHAGCPLNNLIPDWNELAYRGRWRAAIRRLHATNNFPEFTGRVCPAPCEESCVLGINEPAVAIRTIERAIVDEAWTNGWIEPQPAPVKTGLRVAVVGSGPAGLAAAQQLARAGHDVTVYEKADRAGGLLRYGIPDFKLEKSLVDRRLAQMEAEGVHFLTGVEVGVDIGADELGSRYSALLLAGGAETPRDLVIPGRKLKGIHFAMEFLPLNNRRNAGDAVPASAWISAAGRHVVIIGGGDTGADCLGTCHRHKAASITQFEILPQPPSERAASTPWPVWPYVLRQETSHEEGGERVWGIQTTCFLGDEDGRVRALQTVKVGPPPSFTPAEGTEQVWAADLVLLAMGFTGPKTHGAIEQLGVALDGLGNVRTGADFMSSVPGVFVAGDMRRGQSLVVWAIAEGRRAAESIHRWLANRS
jgi:glutamate synthase (NADPH/NADH) small chain